MSRMQKIFLISLLISLVGIGFAVFLMFWGPEKIDLAGRSISQLWEDKDLLPIIIVPVMLIIMAVVMVPFFRTIFPGEIKNAVTTQAKVIKVWDTGVSINDNPQVGLLLEFAPPGGNPIQVEGKTIVARLSAALVQPGVTADIKYDPTKPSRLQVVKIHAESSTAEDTSSRLEELEELLQKNLITELEYRQKREDILKSL
jgi:hypothetical protein